MEDDEADALPTDHPLLPSGRLVCRIAVDDLVISRAKLPSSKYPDVYNALFGADCMQRIEIRDCSGSKASVELNDLAAGTKFKLAIIKRLASRKCAVSIPLKEIIYNIDGSFWWSRSNVRWTEETLERYAAIYFLRLFKTNEGPCIAFWEKMRGHAWKTPELQSVAAVATLNADVSGDNVLSSGRMLAISQLYGTYHRHIRVQAPEDDVELILDSDEEEDESQEEEEEDEDEMEQ